MKPVALLLASVFVGLAPSASANPYWPKLESPKLTTPQWIGEEGVEAVVILSIDDMSDTGKYERFLRPILDRLKKIDGRAAVSITTMGVDPLDPQIQSWLKEGVSIESHTMSHPCPLLAGGDFAKARDTVNRNIDLLFTIPNTEPVSFRMPCCDSQNAVSPRFFSEIMHKTTDAGNFLRADSSVFNLFTPDDKALPKELIAPKSEKKGRLDKYVPRDRGFVNFIENYPYPYVIGGKSWQIPGAVPSDWAGQNLHGIKNPKTIEDWKAGIDCTVIKQGVFALVFHPHGWVDPAQVIELIDHCEAKHGKKVKFLTLRETYERLRDNFLGGNPLRDAKGASNRVRVFDRNGDGFMDATFYAKRKARVWEPKTASWKVVSLPAEERGVISPLGLGIAHRTVDLDGDGDLDQVYSDAKTFWSKIRLADGTWKEGLSGKRGERDPQHEIPMIIREDGSENGAWFSKGWMYIQNEHTGSKPGQVERRILEDFLQPLPAQEDLEKIKPKTPEESLQSMRTRPELEIELVAAEPLVADPVEIAWGPDGKLWVVEMADYPNGLDGKGKSGGRVRFLEDTTGDGSYDKSTLFLEGLNFPTGVLPWRGGVLITAAPEILWAKDTDGDGVADKREVLYDGFNPGKLYPTSVTVERFNDFHTANLVTSTCGTGIYRDQWLGDEFYGNAFICEPVHNLVLRQVLTQKGLIFSSRRASGEEHREFLSSSDNWFRPVTAKTGPDGALYIVDMYRHVIEHPEWIPEAWQKRLDLRRGDDKGRIWRIVRRGKERRKVPRLDQISTDELNLVLSSANGEFRDMVHVEILHRQDRGALALRSIAATSDEPAVRLQALSIIDGMEVKMGPGLLHRMVDRSPEVSRHAIRIAEKMSVTPQLLEALGKLLDDPDARVRHQLHLSLGNLKAPEIDSLIELACRKFREEGAQEAFLRAGLMSSVKPTVAARILAEGHEGMSAALVKDLLATAQGGDEEVQAVEVVRTVIGNPRKGGPPPKEIAGQLKLHSAAAKLTGRPGPGRILFEAQCAVCHRIQGRGNEVGPDLTALTDLSFGSLLTAIVDPNAALEDKFIMHTIVPRKGEELVGSIESETSTAMFLKLADGSQRILLKKDVREVQSAGRSLMPEGFGASHEPQDLADLIKYLQSVRPPPKNFAGNEPALIVSADDGSLTLPAAKAAVYGPRLAYGTQHKMLEWWESDQDHAVWEVDCKTAGEYKVVADIACETRVENRFQVIAGASKVSAIVPQTRNWADFQRKEYGVVGLREGRQEIVVRSDGPVKNFLMDLQTVILTPVK